MLAQERINMEENENILGLIKIFDDPNNSYQDKIKLSHEFCRSLKQTNIPEDELKIIQLTHLELLRSLFQEYFNLN